jgi:hypothetical protein
MVEPRTDNTEHQLRIVETKELGNLVPALARLLLELAEQENQTERAAAA